MAQNNSMFVVFIAVFMMGCSLTFSDDAPTCAQRVEKCAEGIPAGPNVCNNVTEIDAAIACFAGIFESDCVGSMSKNETEMVSKTVKDLSMSRAGCAAGGSGPVPTSGSSTCTKEAMDKCAAIVAKVEAPEQPAPANQTGPAANETAPANQASDSMDAMCGFMNDAKSCIDDVLSGCTNPAMKKMIEGIKGTVVQNMTNHKCCDFEPIKGCMDSVSYGIPEQKPTKDACMAFYKAQPCMEKKLKTCGTGKNAFTESMNFQTSSCEKEGFNDPGSNGMTIQPTLTILLAACLAALSALF